MPYHYQIDPVEKRATIELSGTVTGALIVSSLRALAEDPDWQPGYARLWNVRGATGLVLSLDDVEMVRAELLRERYPARRTALIVKGFDEYSLAELFRARMKSWPVKIFWKEKDALAWLAEQP